MYHYLIRSNVEGEGWTTDGIFAPKEAHDQLAAMLNTEQIARNEGHSFEYRVYMIDPKFPMPRSTIKVDRPELADVRFYVSGNMVLSVPKPSPLNY